MARKSSMLRLIGCLAMAVVAIGAYGRFRCNHKFVDPLSTKLPLWDLDGWSLTHLTLFTLIGYGFPGTFHALAAFALGIGWELTEQYMGKARPAWLGGWGDCDAAEFEAHNANWWFGRYSDIVVNTAGLVFGNMIHKFR